MEKKVLEQYIDACELIKETEKDIRRLKKKRQTIVQTNVSGSNPEFPYNPQHFKIAGTAFTYEEDSRLRYEEKILEERRENAQRLKVEVEQWMNHIPQRMQRIIKYRVFEEMSWSQVASKLGRKATEGSVKWNFKDFRERVNFVTFVTYVTIQNVIVYHGRTAGRVSSFLYLLVNVF